MNQTAFKITARKAAMKKEIPPVGVITLTLNPGRIEDRITLPAEVEAMENLWLKAEVPGQVTEVMAEEGQMLSAGQTLVRLDDRDYRSRLAKIKAGRKLAKADFDRYSQLARTNSIARSRLDEAEARLEELAAGFTEAEVALKRTRIAAPISGRLNELIAKKGDFLSVGDRVAQILQYETVKIRVGVPESDVAAVFDIETAEVLIEALDNRLIIGEKVFLSRKPRTLSRLYDLEMEVPNPDGHILPGMFAKVSLVKNVFENALTLPLYAVITQGDEQFVFIENDKVAKKRAVKIGILTGWQVQITAGLEPGDRVIVVGHRLLSPDQRVTVVKTVDNPESILSS
ncbi:MAG: efflux RND transporter periplasmic adaptor subunit [Deltaproteobacteria bacterium]|nr:efflux RND transporter periplasmic adaptor subunit [Deltaproteobacteria bacterium]